MQTDIKNILTINGGSSSIKFAVYTMRPIPEKLFSGIIERTGPDKSHPDFQHAVSDLISRLEENKLLENLAAIGHRIVHGMQYTEPQIVSESLLTELQKISRYDPNHLPGEIELIRVFQKKLPDVPMVLCFDTSFHTSLPRVAQILPIPRKYDQQGIHRYGFHGLSYSYIMEELERRSDPAATNGRVIVAHLGNGASMAAIMNGESVDTSMGFTPVGGLVMGTRSGDLDPGITALIMDQEKMDSNGYNDFVNHRCGLLGVSETGSDMQDLLKIEDEDIRASEAVSLFCYQAKKWIGAFTAVLKGLDVLVFTGGIGEHASIIRSRICEGLEYLGIEIDPEKNEGGSDIISAGDKRVRVYVIPTNEEFMIAKLVYKTLSNKKI
jgi:acetate kinase